MPRIHAPSRGWIPALVLFAPLLACTNPPEVPPIEEARLPRYLDWLPSGREHPVAPLVTTEDADGVARLALVCEPQLGIDGRRLQRTVSFARLPDGTYQPAIEVRIDERLPDPAPRTLVETIPKSFAAHVSELRFSREPTVVEADPVVSFALDGDETLTIEAVTPVEASALDGSARDAAADVALADCEAIENEDEARSCALGWLERFGDTPAAARVAADCEDPIECAVLTGLRTGDWDAACGGLAGDARGQCFTTLFDVRVAADCQRETDAEARDACLLAALDRVGDDEWRGMLCYDTATQRLVDESIPWGRYGATCASRADRAICDTFAAEETRGRCIGAYARQLRDPTLCDEVAGAWAYGDADCLLDYFRLLEIPSAECEGFGEDARIFCLSLAALAESDTSVCLRLGDAEWTNSCILRVIAQSDSTDTEVCGRMQREQGDTGELDWRSKHDLCVLYTATHASDATRCAQIYDRGFRAWCEIAFAFAADDMQVACASLESPVMRCICGGVGGVAFEDRSLCESITPAEARDHCIAGVVGSQPEEVEPILRLCLSGCVDADGDSFSPVLGCFGEIDCRDDLPEVSPAATERCDDGLDNDCDDATDCDDGDCDGDDACVVTDPTQVVFVEHGGRYTIRLGFAGGEGRSFELVPEAELGMSVYGAGELVDVLLPTYPRDPGEWPGTVPVAFEIEGPPVRSARLYATSNPSDPASRFSGTAYTDLSVPIAVRGDRFYWLEVYPETGYDVLEILRFRGTR
ncbi:MAG: hypothetical protein KC619_10475 [Myxococcales bacterium]|nr:hypothetical protein [Myxococcales bacterium]